MFPSQSSSDGSQPSTRSDSSFANSSFTAHLPATGVLQTPKAVRIMEGAEAVAHPSGPGWGRAPLRSSSIPTILHTPGRRQDADARTPSARAADAHMALATTPGRTPGRTPAKQIPYGIRSSAEICARIAEMGVPFSAEQLRNPTYECMHPVYQTIVRLLLEPSYQFCDDNELSFIRHLMDIVAASGYQGFSIRDLLEPDYKRTKRIFSALLTFNDFRQARLRSYEQALSDCIQHRDRKTVLTREVEALQADIAAREQTLREDRPDVEVAAAESERVVQQLRQRKEERAQLDRQKHDLQTQLNALQDRNAQLKYHMQKLSQEVPHLNQNVVSSPARVQQESAAAHGQVERVKAELTALEDKLNCINILIERNMKADKALDGLLDQMRAVDARKKQYKITKAEIQRLGIARRDGCTDKGAQEEIARLQAQQKEMTAKWNRLQDPLRDRHLQLVDDIPPSREEQDILVMDLQNDINEKMTQITTADQRHKGDVKKLMDVLCSLECKVQGYTEAVNYHLQPPAGGPGPWP